MSDVVVTVSIGPESAPLAVSSDCSEGISWVKLTLPEWTLRYLYAPPSAYVAGDVLLSAVPDSGIALITIAVDAVSLTDLETKRLQVEAALSAWPGQFKVEVEDNDETVTLAGPWKTFPTTCGWGDVIPTLLGHYSMETVVSLPVNPPGAP